MVGVQDCSGIPTEFRPGVKKPEPETDDGTIYGQVFPSKAAGGALPTAEIHYYHLWRRDCGAMVMRWIPSMCRCSCARPAAISIPQHGRRCTGILQPTKTLFAMKSQIARASTPHAVNHGARIWIIPGKEASSGTGSLGLAGCGETNVQHACLEPGKLINLERLAGREGDFHRLECLAASAQNCNTNFPAGPVARLNQLPDSDIAWFNAGRHPAQGVIAVSSSTQQALARSGQNTTSAISVAGDSTNTLPKSNLEELSKHEARSRSSSWPRNIALEARM